MQSDSAEPISNPLGLDENELRSLIGEKAFAVLRRGATEPAFQGLLTDNEAPGKYLCAVCDALIFNSAKKFHSGCGWPSFFDSAAPGAVRELTDYSYGRIRTEIRCANCDSHLGHVFDGEGYGTPTDRRFCVNSISMKFVSSQD
jgi:methionine-R-sulfoxide reductase